MRLFWFVLFFPLIVCGTDLKPWLTPDFEIRPSFDAIFQGYRSIAAPYRSVSKHANDQFYHASIELSAINFSGEIETTFANTHRQRGACDNWRLTGRYRFLDDIIGDPVTLTAGLTLTQAFRHSLLDISSFHHGQFEAELHLAVGREASSLDMWTSRWWGICGLGMADRGYPWVHTEFVWEKNFWGENIFGVSAHSLIGLGPRKIHPHAFRGYGPIGHQSLDLGVHYMYTGWLANLIFEYRHRVYAKNFPKQTNLFIIGLCFPLSPVDFYPTRFLLQQIKLQ